MSCKRCLEYARGSGIILPIFSLPSDGGIGTIGKEAYKFVDFLEKAGQKYWQILPLGHTGFGNSPYQCYSVIAGNPLFIDFETLKNEGLLSEEMLDEALEMKKVSRISYDEVIEGKYSILRTIYENFPKAYEQEYENDIRKFLKDNEKWIFDYSVFMFCKEHFNGKPIWKWPEDVRTKKNETIWGFYDNYRDKINFYIFIQYLFFKQWKNLKDYANSKGIKIIGDMPIYPASDSVEVWKHPELFKVDPITLKPYLVAGVPPDDCSSTGQRWGNPVYDWEYQEKTNYEWWIWKYQANLKIYDIIRLDHFRGYSAYWEIPENETTAENGKWIEGPRMKLFNALYEHENKPLNFIAEDLGTIDDNVRKLLKESGFPGMNVMVYGLHANEDNIYLPHNWNKNSASYITTHDTGTLLEELENLSKEDRKFALEYVRCIYSYEDVVNNFIRTVYASNANIVLLSFQDLLKLNQEGRINLPGTIGDNWSWRTPKDSFNNNLAEKLNNTAKIYKR